jgi:hypothetical protein
MRATRITAVHKEDTPKLLCPDKKKECPDSSTCCMTAKGYGCCPFYKATCCKDKEHCCPHAFVCRDSRCIFDSENFPFYMKNARLT